MASLYMTNCFNPTSEQTEAKVLVNFNHKSLVNEALVLHKPFADELFLFNGVFLMIFSTTAATIASAPTVQML